MIHTSSCDKFTPTFVVVAGLASLWDLDHHQFQSLETKHVAVDQWLLNMVQWCTVYVPIYIHIYLCISCKSVYIYNIDTTLECFDWLQMVGKDLKKNIHIPSYTLKYPQIWWYAFWDSILGIQKKSWHDMRWCFREIGQLPARTTTDHPTMQHVRNSWTPNFCIQKMVRIVPNIKLETQHVLVGGWIGFIFPNFRGEWKQ